MAILDPEGTRDEDAAAVADHRSDDGLGERIATVRDEGRIAGKCDIAPGVDERAVEIQKERRRRGDAQAHVRPSARCRRSIIREMNGVKMSCIASSMRWPGTTIVFARDMNEPSIILRR